MRRDKLLALFWPELSQERGRNALNKAVHFVRQALGDEALVSRGDEEVGVDTSRLWCDAAAFSRAVEDGHLAEALDLYRGELLPAFYLDGTPAFEEWLEQERDRLRRLAAGAARQLAEKCERQGQLEGAVGYARRAVELSGDADERSVRQLLELLDRLGDRAGALYAYETFAQLLAGEYDVAPAAETQALIERIRARVDTENAPTSGSDAARPLENRSDALRERPILDPVRARTLERGWQRLRTARRPVLAGVSAAAITLIAAAVYPIAGRSGAADQNVIAVLPFRVTGPDSSSTYLREGAIDLANAMLAADGLPRVVDARTTLAAWRRAVGSAGELSLEQSLALAGRLGAEHAVLGELVATPGGISASARMVRVTDRKVLATHSSFAKGGEIQLVTGLLGRIFAMSAGDPVDRASGLSDSAAAVRAYLAGLHSFRAGRSDALTHFDRALAVDSTFVAAALRRAMYIPPSPADVESAGRRAWALRGQMNGRDRAQLAAVWGVGPDYPNPYTTDRLLAAADRAARLNPDRLEAWTSLAELLSIYGDASSVEGWQAIAARAADSAIALDSGSVGAVHVRRRVAMMQGDASAIRRYSDLMARLRPDPLYADVMRWLAAGVVGDSAALSAMRAQMPSLASRLRRARWTNAFDAYGSLYALSLGDAERAVRADYDELRADPAARAVWHLPLFAMAVYRGNVPSALAWVDSIPLADRPYFKLSLALVEPGFDVAGPDAARFFTIAADTASEAPDPALLRSQVADAVCFAELWRASRGDTTNTRRAIARIRASVRKLSHAPFQRVGRLGVCPLLLEAVLEWESGRRAETPALDELEALMRRGVGLELPWNVANIYIARWRGAQGAYDAALAASRRKPHFTRTRDILAVAYLREEGRFAALAGDTAGAIRAYERYLTIRDDPDPGPMADDVRRVREHLAALTAATRAKGGVRSD